MLNDILRRATREHWAVGHFNISNLEQLRAIAEAMKETKAYAMIGLSEGERKHIGLRQAAALARAFENEIGIPMFLNADHSKSVESAAAAADAGFNSIHIDASEHPYEENVRMTKAVVEHVRGISSAISVEGELGFVPGESKVERTTIAIDELLYTNPDSVADFVERTGIDRLAVFVGNVHGLHASEPKLDIARIRKIRAAVPERVVLVLHAGSGISDTDIQTAIAAGIANIHISTELRVAFTGALRKMIEEHAEETTPYKLMKGSMEAVRGIVEMKIVAFGGAHKV